MAKASRRRSSPASLPDAMKARDLQYRVFDCTHATPNVIAPTHGPCRSSYFSMSADAEGLSLKRKKTVTWADGEQLPEVGRQEQQEGEESDGGGGPGVVVLPSTDFLFAELDTDIVMEQQGVWVQRW
jgi:hypothetical protein